MIFRKCPYLRPKRELATYPTAEAHLERGNAMPPNPKQLRERLQTEG